MIILALVELLFVLFTYTVAPEWIIKKKALSYAIHKKSEQKELSNII